MEGLDIKSREHEELRELCAASVSERLSPEEEERLSAHLAACDHCRTKLGQYRAIEQFGLPMAASADFRDEELAIVPREQEQKTLKRLLDQCAVGAPHIPLREVSLGAQEGMFRNRSGTFTPAFAAILRYAAGILVAVTIFLSGYRLALERNKKSSTELHNASQQAVTSIAKQMEALLAERNALGRAVQEKDSGEAKLVAKIREQEAEIKQLSDAKRETEEHDAQVEL